MNLFNAQGRLLHISPPKAEGKSALLLMAVGVQKNTRETLIQMVNKILVRVPGRIYARLGELRVDDFYEIYGNVNPLEKRNLSTMDTHLTTELLVSGIKRVVPTGKLKKQELWRTLYSRWSATGTIVDYRKNAKPDRPDTIILQIRDGVKDKGLHLQGSSRVAMSVGKRLKERLVGIEMGDSVYVEGRTAGILRRVPTAVPGEYEQTLHNGLSLAHIHVLGVKEDWKTQEEANAETNVDEDMDDSIVADDDNHSDLEPGEWDKAVANLAPHREGYSEADMGEDDT